MNIEPTPDTPPGFSAVEWLNPTGEVVVTMYAPEREPVHVLKDETPRYLLAAYGHIVTGGAK